MPIKKIELIKVLKLNLFVDYVVEENKPVKVQAAAIAQNNKVLISNSAKLVQFRNELYLFDRGDENNRIVSIETTSSKDKKYVTVLVLSIDEKNHIKIGRSDAKTIHDWLNLMLFSKPQQFHDAFATIDRDDDEWAKALQDAGMLN